MTTGREGRERVKEEVKGERKDKRWRGGGGWGKVEGRKEESE